MAESGSATDVDLAKWKYGPPKNYVLKRFKWIKYLGSGAYGDVIEVLQLSSNTLMAMKLLRRDQGWNSPGTTNLVPILILVATETLLPSGILEPKITTKSVVL